MTVRAEIGEICISTKDYDYVFKPSFKNISKIGSSTEIIDAYSVLAGLNVHAALSHFKRPPYFVMQYLNNQLKKRLPLAINVLECCCDDDIDKLVGKFTGNRLRYRKGVMSPDSIILIAKTLLDHGVIGMAKVRVSQRNQAKKYTTEFKVIDYITNARVHLGLSREESENLSMTEYIMMMANKFPDNSGLAKSEYDDIADSYLERRKKRLESQKS